MYPFLTPIIIKVENGKSGEQPLSYGLGLQFLRKMSLKSKGQNLCEKQKEGEKVEGCRLKHGSVPSHHLSWADAVCRVIPDLTRLFYCYFQNNALVHLMEKSRIQLKQVGR